VIGTKVGHFVLNPGDVMRAIGGGGGGLGDSLLRDAAVVASDVRDGYITIEHAEAAYGVVVNEDGRVNVSLTTRRRNQLRTARIGKLPNRAATAPRAVGISVAVRDHDGQRAWTCEYCAVPLAALTADWRDVAVRQEMSIAGRYAELGMRVRERDATPSVKVLEFYCPCCASCLAADVATDRRATGSPMLTEGRHRRDIARIGLAV
jgi:N-methylhydantoinase B